MSCLETKPEVNSCCTIYIPYTDIESIEGIWTRTWEPGPVLGNLDPYPYSFMYSNWPEVGSILVTHTVNPTDDTHLWPHFSCFLCWIFTDPWELFPLPWFSSFWRISRQIWCIPRKKGCTMIIQILVILLTENIDVLDRLL